MRTAGAVAPFTLHAWLNPLEVGPKPVRRRTYPSRVTPEASSDLVGFLPASEGGLWILRTGRRMSKSHAGPLTCRIPRDAMFEVTMRVASNRRKCQRPGSEDPLDQACRGLLFLRDSHLQAFWFELVFEGGSAPFTHGLRNQQWR